MAGTFEAIQERQNNVLANSKTGSYSRSQRDEALNDALKEVWYFTDWSQLTVYTDLTFDASGEADIPTGFFKTIRLYEEDSDTNTEVKTEYEYLQQQDFLSDVVSTFTITDDGSGTEIFKIHEAEVITLKLWYVKKSRNDDMSESTDTTGLVDDFDLPIAMLSVAILAEQKNKGSSIPHLLRYGQSGNQRNPTPQSAYGWLNKLLQHYKQRSKRNTGRVRYFHENNNFYP